MSKTCAPVVVTALELSAWKGRWRRRGIFQRGSRSPFLIPNWFRFSLVISWIGVSSFYQAIFLVKREVLSVRGDTVPCVTWTHGSWSRNVAKETRQWVGVAWPISHCWLSSGGCVSSTANVSFRNIRKEGIASQEGGETLSFRFSLLSEETPWFKYSGVDKGWTRWLQSIPKLLTI